MSGDSEDRRENGSDSPGTSFSGVNHSFHRSFRRVENQTAKNKTKRNEMKAEQDDEQTLQITD